MLREQIELHGTNRFDLFLYTINLKTLVCSRILVFDMWCFNMIRRRSNKIGRSYDHVVSRRFNECISDLQLLDLPLQDRNFT